MRHPRDFGARVLATLATIALVSGCSGGRTTPSFMPPPSATSITPQAPPPDVWQYTADPTLQIIPGPHISSMMIDGQSDDGGRTTAEERRALATGGNVTYHGGATVATAQVVVISVNSLPTSSTYGDPCTFWLHMNNSTMIHILDQYVNSTANNRYPCTAQHQVNISGTVSDTEAGNIIKQFLLPGGGSGQFNAIYDIFVPRSAYSGGSGSCAFHSSMNVGGQEVIWAMESGDCGYLDEMNHENFESFSDPTDGGWRGTGSDSEIGDLCTSPKGPVTLDGVAYNNIQKEWSNAAGGCTYNDSAAPPPPGGTISPPPITGSGTTSPPPITVGGPGTGGSSWACSVTLNQTGTVSVTGGGGVPGTCGLGTPPTGASVCIVTPPGQTATTGWCQANPTVGPGPGTGGTGSGGTGSGGPGGGTPPGTGHRGCLKKTA